LLYAFFWVIPRRLNFYMPTFRNTLFRLHRQVVTKIGTDRVSRNVGTQNSDAGGITRKKAYNIQNKVKVWNLVFVFCVLGFIFQLILRYFYNRPDGIRFNLILSRTLCPEFLSCAGKRYPVLVHVIAIFKWYTPLVLNIG
jgi:hypothetical protein